MLQGWSPRNSTVASHLPAPEAHLRVRPFPRLFCALLRLCQPLLWPNAHSNALPWSSPLISPAGGIQISFLRAASLLTRQHRSLVCDHFACSESCFSGNQCFSVGREMTVPQPHAYRFMHPFLSFLWCILIYVAHGR